ncbi:MAG: glutathione S-transferase family protein [Acetobacteraceae bacterium]|jgi:glutathione S-transferase
MTVTLYAYQYSVYSWVARLVLQEKSVAYNYVEVNPFAPDTPAEYLLRNPFRRVPTLVHDEFVLYETGAITRYIDDVFAGDALRPADRRSLARMAQIISIIDAYGYWPMVRQVYSNRIFRPRVGLPVNEDDVRIGIRSAERTVAALEELAHPHGYLIDTRVSLADLHLAPMIAYFAATDEGRTVLTRHRKLSAWWSLIQTRPAFAATKPGLPGA